MKTTQSLKKFTKQSGQIIRYYEIFVPKSGSRIKEEYYEFEVIISHDNNLVILDQYKKLKLLNIKKVKHTTDGETISNVNAFVRDWGKSLLEYSGVCACLYTFQSEQITRKRVHTALKKLIQREYGAYAEMSDRLDAFLKK